MILPVGVSQRVRRRCRLGFIAKLFDKQQQSFTLVASGFSTPLEPLLFGCGRLICDQLIGFSKQTADRFCSALRLNLF